MKVYQKIMVKKILKKKNKVLTMKNKRLLQTRMKKKKILLKRITIKNQITMMKMKKPKKCMVLDNVK